MKTKKRIIVFMLCFAVTVSLMVIGSLTLATANTQTVFDISKGDIFISSYVLGYDPSGNQIVSMELDPDGYRIIGEGNGHQISVSSVGNINITLDNIRMSGAIDKKCLAINNSTVNLTLVGENIIQAHQDGNTNAVLMQGTSSLNISGDGYLLVHGSSNYYGGGPAIEGGNLTVNSGTVTLVGGNKIVNNYGMCFDGGEITLNGGVLNCYEGLINSADRGNISVTALSIEEGSRLNVGAISLNGSNSFVVKGTLDATSTLPGYVGISGGSVIVNAFQGGAFVTPPTLDGAVCHKVYVDNTPVYSSNITASTYTGNNRVKIESYTVHDIDTDSAIKLDDITHASCCKWCGFSIEGNHTGHYTYSASGSDITATCICEHSLTAKLKLKAGADLTYTGSSIVPMEMEYPVSWPGNTNQPMDTDYINNINAGTASCAFTYESGVTATLDFTITGRELALGMAELSPESGVYNSVVNEKPVITLSYNGTTLNENVDYTLGEWQGDFTKAGNKTVVVTGKGNFTGSVTLTYNIEKGIPTASLFNVVLPQNAVYNSGAHSAEVIGASGLGDITVKYNSSTSAPIDAGEYVITVDVAESTNYKGVTGIVLGSFTIDKAEVAVPVITGKAYNGNVQIADTLDTSRYTVEENSGGVHAGSYDVVLRLTDTANYKWSTTNNDVVTLKFTILKAENGWNTIPDVSGWTYGDAENVTIGEAKFGAVTVTYTGAANDGTSYNSTVAPTKAGSYIATFSVNETSDYSGITKQKSFTIDKASYDMSGVMWDYNGALAYNGNEYCVEVVGLPSGVAVDSYIGNKATSVGTYIAKVTLSYDSDNYIAPTIEDLTWKIENNWNPTEYVLSGNGWLNSNLIITPENGYKISLTQDGTWGDKVIGDVEGASSEITFYLKNEATGAVSLAKTIAYKLDKTPAEGTLSFSTGNTWDELVDVITFDLFYKNEITVSIEASDVLSGIMDIEYFISEGEMSLDEVRSHSAWITYNGGFNVPLEDAKQFVCYARIRDNAGNITYISSNGAEYDITAPVISGVQNGKTYYTTQNIIVTDKNIDAVTLNGVAVTGEFTLNGNTDKEYVIVATDKAGNTSTVAVTMKPVSNISAPIDGITQNNVKSDDKAALESVLSNIDAVDITDATVDEKEILKALKDKISRLESVINNTKSEITRIDDEICGYDEDAVKSKDKDDIMNLFDDASALLEGDNLTDAEKSALENAIAKAQTLLNAINDAESALTTEVIESVSGVTSENVKAEDKGNLENAKQDLEAAIKDNGENYTDDEINLIKDEISRIDNALKAIDNANRVTEMINNLPEAITKDDEDVISSARNAYNALTDNEKSIVGDDMAKVLYDAEKALEALKNPDIDSPNTGDDRRPALFIMLAGVSIMGVIILLSLRKREEA